MLRHYLLRALFTLLALAVLGWYLFAPATMTERFDTMALGLLGLAALPWLGALVEEFKVGGVEAKLRAIREEAEEAVDTAAQAREVAEELALVRPAEPVAPPEIDEFDDLLSSPFGAAPAKPSDPHTDPGSDEDDPATEALASVTRISKPAPQGTARSAADRLLDLAATYAETRASMPSSAARTALMTAIFGDMQQQAARLGGDFADASVWMRSDDPGRQLASVAWLRSFPAAEPPARYIDLIERATQPFVQYWALRALSGRFSALGLTDVSLADRIALKEIESMMRAGTDRHAQIRRINRKLAGRVPVED